MSRVELLILKSIPVGFFIFSSCWILPSIPALCFLFAMCVMALMVLLFSWVAYGIENLVTSTGMSDSDPGLGDCTRAVLLFLTASIGLRYNRAT